jgi:hypothetical protein
MTIFDSIKYPISYPHATSNEIDKVSDVIWEHFTVVCQDELNDMKKLGDDVDWVELHDNLLRKFILEYNT